MTDCQCVRVVKGKRRALNFFHNLGNVQKMKDKLNSVHKCAASSTSAFQSIRLSNCQQASNRQVINNTAWLSVRVCVYGVTRAFKILNTASVCANSDVLQPIRH